MGVDVNRVISFTFVVGAALGAVAGVMVGTYYGIAHYQMGFLLGLKAFSAAVLGGIGNLAGAVLGGILMGLIEALGAGYVGDFTNVCFLDKFLPGFSDACFASPESSLFGSNYKDVLRVHRPDPGARLPPLGAAGRAGRRPGLGASGGERWAFPTTC